MRTANAKSNGLYRETDKDRQAMKIAEIGISP